MNKYLRLIERIIPNAKNIEVDGIILGEIEIADFIADNIYSSEKQLVEHLIPLAAKCELNNGCTKFDALKIDVINTIRHVKGFIPSNFTINGKKTLGELIEYVSNLAIGTVRKQTPRMNKHNTLQLLVKSNDMPEFAFRGKQFVVDILGDNGYRLDLENMILFNGDKIAPIADYIKHLESFYEQEKDSIISHRLLERLKDRIKQ